MIENDLLNYGFDERAGKPVFASLIQEKNFNSLLYFLFFLLDIKTPIV